MNARVFGAGSAQPNAICEVCSARCYTAAVRRTAVQEPCGRCPDCGGPLWPVVGDPLARPQARVYDLETFRRRRR